jgi:hypothetical protein
LSDLQLEEIMKMKRDYNSYIGFYANLPVLTNLCIYPILRKEDKLSANLHVTCNMHTYHEVNGFDSRCRSTCFY